MLRKVISRCQLRQIPVVLNKLSLLFFLALISSAMSTRPAAASGDVVWREDWEDDTWMQRWSSNFGVWDAGVPTNGPSEAYSGTGCAATNLGGNYIDGVDTRLRRHVPFVVPEDAESPRLRLRHWFNFSYSDSGWVEVLADGEWRRVSESFYWYSSVWTRVTVDLEEFRGKEIQVAFRISTANYHGGSVDVAQGWYIDDVEFVTGAVHSGSREGFENGLDDWRVSRGVWQVGQPESGPGEAHGGQALAATVLGGSYYDSQNSRLISPPMHVPSADQSPRLRFWHWYSFSYSDSGIVEVRPVGGEWQVVSPAYTWSSGGWFYTYLDLNDFANQEIEIAFHYSSANYHGGSIDVSSGWYIDDLVIEPVVEDCGDGSDNDGDGLVDCADEDCECSGGASLRIDILEPQAVRESENWTVDVPLGTDVAAVTAGVYLLSNFGEEGEGVRGWSFSLEVPDCLELATATTAGTVGADVRQDSEGMRMDGFEHTEIVSPDAEGNDGRSGVVSAVVLSNSEDITLPPVGEVLVLDLQGTMSIDGASAVGDTTPPCVLRTADAESPLRGSGQPVPSIVTVGDVGYPVRAEDTSISLRRVGAGFVRGDANSSGAIDITDGIRVLAYLFLGESEPECLDAADVTDDGSIEITDSIALFSWLFLGGPAPADPSPTASLYTLSDCGADLTPDSLSCDRSLCR